MADRNAKLCLSVIPASHRTSDAYGDVRIASEMPIANWQWSGHFCAVFASSRPALIELVPRCSPTVGDFFLLCMYGAARLPFGRQLATRVSLRGIASGGVYVQRHVRVRWVPCGGSFPRANTTLFWPAVSVDVDGVPAFLPSHYGVSPGADDLFALDAAHALPIAGDGPMLTVYADPAWCYDVTVEPVWLSAFGAVVRHCAGAVAGALIAGTLAVSAIELSAATFDLDNGRRWRLYLVYFGALFAAVVISDISSSTPLSVVAVILAYILPAAVGVACVVAAGGMLPSRGYWSARRPAGVCARWSVTRKVLIT